MKFTILQNKGPKNVQEAFDASLGNVDPAFFAKHYKEVAVIEAEDLNEVFEIGNVGPEYKIKRLDRMHSISVGDVIMGQGSDCFVVDMIGFKRLGE
jgi:hypothetical protein